MATWFVSYKIFNDNSWVVGNMYVEAASSLQAESIVVKILDDMNTKYIILSVRKVGG